MSQQYQPIFILPENAQRTSGRDAQRNNIAAAKAVAETVRTTLGPKGMDKMIVDSLGEVIVTNDGVTILKELNVEHPVAKMIVEVAKTQEEEVGDGTTTAVVLTGELLKNAEDLLDKEIHPTLIAKGYRIAGEKTKRVLNQIAEKIKDDDEDVIKKLALTAMTGKGAEVAKEHLATILSEAVKNVRDKNEINKNDIKFEKKIGEGVEDSEIIQGIIIDKEKVHSGMPSSVKNGKIALLDVALEVKDTETDAKIQITEPSQLQAFVEQEEKTIKDLSQKVIDTGAKVVFCQKGIDDLAQYFLANAGIYAVRRVKKTDMEKLARATGARIVSNLNELNAENLGEAGIVESTKIGDEEMTAVKECKNPKSVTFLIRGGTQHVVDEIERSLTDALGDIAVAISSSKVLGGAGAPEMEVAKELRKYAQKFPGREKLAILAFAEAVEVIPRTLAENSGLDPIDLLTALGAAHEKDQKWAGINVFDGKVIDAWEEGIIEPLKIKTQAIKSAVEVVELILRIDDVISTGGTSHSAPPQMPPGGMGGMPDMGGMM